MSFVSPASTERVNNSNHGRLFALTGIPRLQASERKPPVQSPPLSLSRNIDGRPVWEPPILNYTDLIDDETNTKRREAVMQYTNNDIAKTTDIMDVYTELRLLWDYKIWAIDNSKQSQGRETSEFFETLSSDLLYDESQVGNEDEKKAGGRRTFIFGVRVDGTWSLNVPWVTAPDEQSGPPWGGATISTNGGRRLFEEIERGGKRCAVQHRILKHTPPLGLHLHIDPSTTDLSFSSTPSLALRMLFPSFYSTEHTT